MNNITRLSYTYISLSTTKRLNVLVDCVDRRSCVCLPASFKLDLAFTTKYRWRKFWKLLSVSLLRKMLCVQY